MVSIVSILDNLKEKEVIVSIQGQIVKANLISFDKDTLLVESDNKHLFVPINKISFIGCEKDNQTNKIAKEFEALPEMTIVGCIGNNCKGVKMMKSGSKETITTDDYKLMIDECPLKNESCRCGVVGSLSKIKKEELSNIMNNLIIGEYPQKAKGRPKKTIQHGEE